MAYGWLLLIHQLPPEPAYLRVKIGRRLAKIGAVQLKSTVYVLPSREEQLEDMQWLRKEIVADGGEATVVEAKLLDGHDDDDVIKLFRAARAPEWETLIEDLRSAKGGDTPTGRLRARFDDIARIDYFDAKGRARALTMLEALEEQGKKKKRGVQTSSSYRGRTWVTREKMKVDRLSCAWAVKRFVDPTGKLKLVPGKGYVPKKGEVLFDMFDVDGGAVPFELISHEGNKCSLEVLLERAGVIDAGLRAIAEIVHDVDLKDAKFGRPETAGVASMIDAIALHDDDDVRLARASALFDDLHALLSKSGRRQR